MISGSNHRKKTNRVMHGMIGISFFFHFLAVIHFSGIFQSDALSYIELTMKDVSKPSPRLIPRPRRIRNNSEMQDIQKVTVKKHYTPRIQFDPADYEYPRDLMEKIETPDIPDHCSLGGSDRFFESIGGEMAPDDYFSMVRLKIENCKKYPKAAERKHHEGIVKVGFMITSDGQLSSLKIVKGTRYADLNQAALNAVMDAAPFSHPPAELKGPLRLEINIVFELM